MVYHQANLPLHLSLLICSLRFNPKVSYFWVIFNHILSKSWLISLLRSNALFILSYVIVPKSSYLFYMKLFFCLFYFIFDSDVLFRATNLAEWERFTKLPDTQALDASCLLLTLFHFERLDFLLYESPRLISFSPPTKQKILSGKR